MEAEEEVRQLFELAGKLEDLTRNVGMHAGGVLIAPGKLTDFCPLYSTDGGASVVSQYDKDDVEKVGLVKFDFLGLRNLTIIDLAVVTSSAADRQRPDLDLLTFDDPAAYQILKDANTTAIFQVESEGMKKLLKKLAAGSLRGHHRRACALPPQARSARGWSMTSSCARRASRRSTTSTTI
jgi:DNA polymerase-3 subunit alpha